MIADEAMNVEQMNQRHGSYAEASAHAYGGAGKEFRSDSYRMSKCCNFIIRYSLFIGSVFFFLFT
jgi:hypothetical protein